MDADFEDLLPSTHRPLRAFIAARGVRPDQVDDLAQEVYLAYHREPARRPAEVEPLIWLKGIARNLCNQHFRGDERRQRLLVRISDAVEAAAVSDDLIDEDPRAERLRACLGRLAPRIQELLRRYHHGEEQPAGLAQALGLGLSALRMTVLRAREQLRRCLGAQEA